MVDQQKIYTNLIERSFVLRFFDIENLIIFNVNGMNKLIKYWLITNVEHMDHAFYKHDSLASSINSKFGIMMFYMLREIVSKHNLYVQNSYNWCL